MPIFHDIPTTHEGFLIQPLWDDPLRVTAPDLSLPRPPPERKASRTVSRSLCNTSWRAEEHAKTSHTGHFFHRWERGKPGKYIEIRILQDVYEILYIT